MPWFPDFVSAVELARRATRAAGRADPVMQYFTALNDGETDALEAVWPGEVVIHDPRAGEVRGHRQLRRFVSENRSWLAGLHPRTETVASTVADGRAVVELLAHLSRDGRELGWPVDGRHHVRSAVLGPGRTHPGDVVGRFQAGLDAGDTDAVVGTFASDGYYREPIGPRAAHRGTAELRTFFTARFGDGGGIGLQHCAVTDDGVRCALEYNCVRWGSRDLPAQAGIGVFERGPDGLLAAARIYDDVEVPAGQP